MQELNTFEVDQVSGGRINVSMIRDGGILLIIGGVAVATGGFALVAVGSIAIGAGGGWAALGFTS